MRHDAHGWWLREAGPVEPRLPLRSRETADVLVVGGGFTGLWTAWLVSRLEPHATVALVESDVCGLGPSGRNAGFANTMWFSLPSMRPRFGEVGAIGVARASQEAVDEIGRWCSEQEVDAWFRQDGYLQVSTTPLHDGAWAPTLEACAQLGEPEAVRELSAAEVAERCGSPIFRGGALYPGSATVNPALLALGLRRRLLESGVAVYERSRVRELRCGRGWAEARCHGGSIRAGAAVIAAGGAQAALRPLRRRLTLTSSHMLITEPVPDVLAELGWTGGECITDSRAMIHYMRTTPDGRIAFGWGGGRVVAGARTNGRAEVDARVVAEVARHLVRFFPSLRGRKIEHAWGGPIDVSPSHVPVVGTLDGPVHYGFGYTGNGVGPSRMVARALASLALDRRDRHSRLAIVEPRRLQVPPEPLRFAGGTVIRTALLRKETAEEEGREADPWTRFVAGIPERIGIHVGR